MAAARLVRFPLSKIRVAAGFRFATDAAGRLECSRVHLLNVERGATGASDALINRMATLYRVAPETVGEAIQNARRDYLRRLREAV